MGPPSHCDRLRRSAFRIPFSHGARSAGAPQPDGCGASLRLRSERTGASSAHRAPAVAVGIVDHLRPRREQHRGPARRRRRPATARARRTTDRRRGRTRPTPPAPRRPAPARRDRAPRPSPSRSTVPNGYGRSAAWQRPQVGQPAGQRLVEPVGEGGPGAAAVGARPSRRTAGASRRRSGSPTTRRRRSAGAGRRRTSRPATRPRPRARRATRGSAPSAGSDGRDRARRPRDRGTCASRRGSSRSAGPTSLVRPSRRPAGTATTSPSTKGWNGIAPTCGEPGHAAPRPARRAPVSTGAERGSPSSAERNGRATDAAWSSDERVVGRAALHDGPAEQALGRRHRHEVEDRAAAGRLAEHGHVAGVAAELG